MKKLPLTLTILSILIVFTILPGKAALFPDIKSPLLLEAVEYLNEKEIIKGYPDGTFKPEQVINRAEALKIIFLSLGEEEILKIENSPFPDVDKDAWFSPYIQAGKTKGIIAGYPDGYYRPTQEVNKAEFIKIAMLAQSYYHEPNDHTRASNQFSDISTDAWYTPYVAFALEFSFLDTGSKLRPTEGMSRGEASLIIYRLSKHNEKLVKKDPDELTPDDFVEVPDEIWTPTPLPEDQVKVTVLGDNSKVVQHFSGGYELVVTSDLMLTTPDTTTPSALIIDTQNCRWKIYYNEDTENTSAEEHYKQYIEENIEDNPDIEINLERVNNASSELYIIHTKNGVFGDSEELFVKLTGKYLVIFLVSSDSEENFCNLAQATEYFSINLKPINN